MKLYPPSNFMFKGGTSLPSGLTPSQTSLHWISKPTFYLSKALCQSRATQTHICPLSDTYKQASHFTISNPFKQDFPPASAFSVTFWNHTTLQNNLVHTNRISSMIKSPRLCHCLVLEFHITYNLPKTAFPSKPFTSIP